MVFYPQRRQKEREESGEDEGEAGELVSPEGHVGLKDISPFYTNMTSS